MQQTSSHVHIVYQTLDYTTEPAAAEWNQFNFSGIMQKKIHNNLLSLTMCDKLLYTGCIQAIVFMVPFPIYF